MYVTPFHCRPKPKSCQLKPVTCRPAQEHCRQEPVTDCRPEPPCAVTDIPKRDWEDEESGTLHGPVYDHESDKMNCAPSEE